MEDAKIKCPCCGYYTLDEFYDSYDICPVCFWEEDLLQLINPIEDGGANGCSLIRARLSFKRTGVSEERFAEDVRPPLQEELHGIDYESPRGEYDEANDVLYIRYYWPDANGLSSRMRELDWRYECSLPRKETDNRIRRKPITFRETIRKLSTYEIKKSMFRRLMDSDFTFIQDRMNLNKEQLQNLSDDEMNDFWKTLSRMADLEDNKDAHDLRAKLQWWAEPCWEVPKWMTEW